MIARKLKGLEDFITVSVVHCHLGESGRRFVSTGDDEPGENAIPDPTDGYEGFPRLREVYYETEKECQGRYTVPVLYDKIMKRIVNNESSEIIRMLGSEVCASCAAAKIYMRLLTQMRSLMTSLTKSTVVSTYIPKSSAARLMMPAPGSMR